MRAPEQVGPYDVLRRASTTTSIRRSSGRARAPARANERLVVAYHRQRTAGDEAIVGASAARPTSRGPAGRDTIESASGTPRCCRATPAFDAEIRSVYRLGGEDVRRETCSSRRRRRRGDQEKPIGGAVETYLQMFGLAQPDNPSSVRRREPPLAASERSEPGEERGAGGREADPRPLPRLPVAAAVRRLRALADPPNPANDTLYRTRRGLCSTQRRPPHAVSPARSLCSRGRRRRGHAHARRRADPARLRAAHPRRRARSCATCDYRWTTSWAA